MSDGRWLTIRAVSFWGGLFLFLLLAKLCHLDILWAEEGYGSAAAVQILHGKMLYRDFWFDKPPLAALVYVFGTAARDWVCAWRMLCTRWHAPEPHIVLRSTCGRSGKRHGRLV